MSKCCIIGASELYYNEIKINEGDLVIAADGGLKHCEAMGIRPDLIVGDFDSYGSSPEGDNIIRLNPIKDDTDTMMCIKLGLEKGFDTFVLYGCTGGRFSHTLGNLQILSYLRMNNARGYLMGEYEITTVICNEEAIFSDDCRGYISLFAMDRSIIATEKGLKYSLNGYELTNQTTLGVSNEFMGAPSSIRTEGLAAIVYDKNNGIDAIRFIGE